VDATNNQLDIETELYQLTRLDALILEKALADQHRRIWALVGQLEHYGCPQVADDLRRAAESVTSAGVALTLSIRHAPAAVRDSA